MRKLTKKSRASAKRRFTRALRTFVARLGGYVAAEDGQWSVRGFIDIYKNIYTVSSDTKVVSKILEIHLFPHILQFAEEVGYSIVLAEHQNWYPDFSFVDKADERIKFAVDLKTTYRDPDYPGHVNGFTLGSHGAYFRDRSSTKNIQFPYAEYSGHFCLGVIYTRADARTVDETDIINVRELDDQQKRPRRIGRGTVTTVENLRSIASVIKDFQFFLCEKWQLASDRQGSGNTANIGSITSIDDILKGNGVFAKLGEKWFDEYWMNYGVTTMMKKGESVPIRRIEDFLDFKGGDRRKIVAMAPKRKRKVATS